MRKNFAQIMSERTIDLKKEYTKLYHILYDKTYSAGYGEYYSYYDILNTRFPKFWFRDTCLSLKEFDKQNGFKFEKDPLNFNIDYLIGFCEYLYNLTTAYRTTIQVNTIDSLFIIEQINKIINQLNYNGVVYKGFMVFVPNNVHSVEVSNIVEEYSLEILYYNHHSLKGDIESKRELLNKFAMYLEPLRTKLKEINKSFESDLFQLINKMNIRHNNINVSDKAHYVDYVAKMNKEELEKWYDVIYQMILKAILDIEIDKGKRQLKDLISNINIKS